MGPDGAQEVGWVEAWNLVPGDPCDERVFSLLVGQLHPPSSATLAPTPVPGAEDVNSPKIDTMNGLCSFITMTVERLGGEVADSARLHAWVTESLADPPKPPSSDVSYQALLGFLHDEKMREQAGLCMPG